MFRDDPKPNSGKKLVMGEGSGKWKSMKGSHRDRGFVSHRVRDVLDLLSWPSLMGIIDIFRKIDSVAN